MERPHPLTVQIDAMIAEVDRRGRGSEAEQQAAREAVLHEWGTFTSLHLPDGSALQWTANTDTHALPSFVHRPGDRRRGPVVFQAQGRHDGPTELPCDHPRARPFTKGACVAEIRMETPVIYVHVPGPARLRIAVDFVDGHHTEWFPAVREDRRVDNAHRLDWGWFSATPGGTAALPTEAETSPYYAARNVDAALLRVDDEVERFLFYRGIANFAPTVRPTADDDAVRWDGVGAGSLIVYERRGDRSGATVLNGPGVAPRAALRSGDPRVFLRQMLLAEGLFADEVEAMLSTWEDDWFEPGLRAFYLLPSAEIDARLPLHVDPAPEQIVRVIVGRAELLDPAEARRLASTPVEEIEPRRQRFASAFAQGAWLVSAD